MPVSFCFPQGQSAAPWSYPRFKTPRGPMRPGCKGTWQGEARPESVQGGHHVLICRMENLFINRFMHMFQSSWSDFADFEKIFVRISNTISGECVLGHSPGAGGALPGHGKGLTHLLQSRPSLSPRLAPPVPTQCPLLGTTPLARGFYSLDVQG